MTKNFSLYFLIAYLVYCDRGLGRVSLNSHKIDLLKLKMKFNGDLTALVRG